MLDKIILNLKIKFSATPLLCSDVTIIPSTTYEEESESTFFDYFRINNILNVSYSPLFQRRNKSQQHDEPLESRMFPRVYATPTTDLGGPWSPVALVAKERPLEELDDVVEKFIRVIAVEPDRKSNKNVNVIILLSCVISI
jgi:hypothetical protein